MFKIIKRALKYALLEEGKVYRYRGENYALRYKGKKRVTLVLLDGNDNEVRIENEWASDFCDGAEERKSFVVQRIGDGHYYYGEKDNGIVMHTDDILIARTLHSFADAVAVANRIGIRGRTHKPVRIEEWMSW